MTDLTIQDCVFEENPADSSFGGAVALGSLTISQSYGDLSITDSQFINNETGTYSNAFGGALLVNTADAVMMSA